MRVLSFLILCVVVQPCLFGQNSDAYRTLPIDTAAQRPNAIISLNAGPILTSSRGDFPSLLIGNTMGGSGTVPGEYSTTGTGHTLQLDVLLYFGERAGMTIGFSSTRYAATFDGDSILLPTKLEVQQGEVQVGAHVDVIGEPWRPKPGLRSLYLEGGFEFGIGILANRVEGSMLQDSTSEIRTAAVGSFENNNPFRNRVALRFGLGTIIDLTTDWGTGLNLILEAGYSLGLNPVFSSNVIQDNSFTVDHLVFQAGLGYRF